MMNSAAVLPRLAPPPRRVGPVLPKETAHWSTTGAADESQVVCVIRQALARS